MLVIWGRKNSINVQKTMWTVGELGLAHERINVGGPFGGLDTPDYRELNPNGLAGCGKSRFSRALIGALQPEPVGHVDFV